MSVEVLQETTSSKSEAIAIHLHPAIELTDEQFFMLCQINRDLLIERTAEGDLIVMPPTGFLTGTRNMDIAGQLQSWAKHDGTGIATDSSTGFKLPNDAVRAPDAAWTRREKLAALSSEQKGKFLPLCPDFVIELRSSSDTLEKVQAKMEEYIESGAQLGWLLDPFEKKVHVYRADKTIEILEGVSEISGEPVLKNFMLDLRDIWNPNI